MLPGSDRSCNFLNHFLEPQSKWFYFMRVPVIPPLGINQEVKLHVACSM
jgi:hypothetical protein